MKQSLGPPRFILLMLLLSLACNAISPGARATLPPAPPQEGVTPRPSLPTATPAPTNTSAALLTPLPTFTPRSVTRVSGGATASPQPTITLRSTITTTLTLTVERGGPLALRYAIRWRLSDEDPSLAIATITLLASGGSGDYTYYHDDLRQSGPVFTFRWRVCNPKPGSFRVDSSDGQSARLDYFERPPCPNP